MISIPNLRPFWSSSQYNIPFRVRSAEVTLTCPDTTTGNGAWGYKDDDFVDASDPAHFYEFLYLGNSTVYDSHGV